MTCPRCPPIEDCPECEECPSCPECPVYPECPQDTTPYAECDSCCPVCPLPTDCPEVTIEDCEQFSDDICPTPTKLEEFWMWIYGLIGVIVGLAGGEGFNIIIRRNARTGKIQTQISRHKHKGHTRLHSIYTEHHSYWHPKGVVNPKYDANGKYIGGE